MQRPWFDFIALIGFGVLCSRGPKIEGLDLTAAAGGSPAQLRDDGKPVWVENINEERGSHTRLPLHATASTNHRGWCGGAAPPLGFLLDTEAALVGGQQRVIQTPTCITWLLTPWPLTQQSATQCQNACLDQAAGVCRHVPAYLVHCCEGWIAFWRG